MEEVELKHLTKLHHRVLRVYRQWEKLGQVKKAEKMEKRFWLWWTEVGQPRLYSVLACE